MRKTAATKAVGRGLRVTSARLVPQQDSYLLIVAQLMVEMGCG
jgi:hypothetical protein